MVIVDKIHYHMTLWPPLAGMVLQEQAAVVNNQKGGSNVVDNFCDLANFVAVGIDQRIHNGRHHSYPADHCLHRVSDSTSSRKENIVAAWPPS